MRATRPPLQDPEDFSNLYSRTHVVIFRYIYGMYGGPAEDVEDLTCDTFFRAWKGRSHFFGDEHAALSWLFTIAHRLVIDAHRRGQVHPENSALSLDDTAFDWVALPSAASPEEQAASREQFRHLWHVLFQLPDDKREVLVLRYMLGWKVKDIAQHINKEENTVSVYIRRCLEQIRDDWSLG
jgi:RNA polymerase sigma-70 factor, ECF subfamily